LDFSEAITKRNQESALLRATEKKILQQTSAELAARESAFEAQSDQLRTKIASERAVLEQECTNLREEASAAEQRAREAQSKWESEAKAHATLRKDYGELRLAFEDFKQDATHKLHTLQQMLEKEIEVLMHTQFFSQ
jgi:chromosome segregation ATPase